MSRDYFLIIIFASLYPCIKPQWEIYIRTERTILKIYQRLRNIDFCITKMLKGYKGSRKKMAVPLRPYPPPLPPPPPALLTITIF